MVPECVAVKAHPGDGRFVLTGSAITFCTARSPTSSSSSRQPTTGSVSSKSPRTPGFRAHRRNAPSDPTTRLSAFAFDRSPRTDWAPPGGSGRSGVVAHHHCSGRRTGRRHPPSSTPQSATSDPHPVRAAHRQLPGAQTHGGRSAVGSRIRNVGSASCRREFDIDPPGAQGAVAWPDSLCAGPITPLPYGRSRCTAASPSRGSTLLTCSCASSHRPSIVRQFARSPRALPGPRAPEMTEINADGLQPRFRGMACRELDAAAEIVRPVDDLARGNRFGGKWFSMPVTHVPTYRQVVRPGLSEQPPPRSSRRVPRR